MKVLVTGAYRHFNELKKEFNDFDFTFVQNEQERLTIDMSDYEYVICNSLFQYNDIHSFTSLKYIQVTSAGLDRLPMDYIDEKGIIIYNAKGVYSIPMAEWTICKVLDIYKNSYKFYENQKKKIWEKDRKLLELSGKVVAIVGYGSVGREVAKRLHAFNTRIIAIDKKNIGDNIVTEYYDMDNLIVGINNADIVIISLPLTDETEGFFNDRIFQNMKTGSILINIARGKIINTNDLLKNANKFLAIVLDVFEEEPLEKNHPLWELENCIISPHNSFISENNDDRLYEVVTKNLKDSKK